MEEENKTPKKKSDILQSKICDPATKANKSIDKSPGENEINNKMKKVKSKKLNTILKKESRYIVGLQRTQKSMGIKWDNKAIDEQNAYRMRHRLSVVQRHKIKSLSRTKYNSAVLGAEDDEYLKNLIKVNQITVSDELIKNIIKALNEPKVLKKVRTYSSNLKEFKFDYSTIFRSAKDNLKVFDDVLDDETKLTLKNTIINKFHKEVLGGN